MTRLALVSVVIGAAGLVGAPTQASFEFHGNLVTCKATLTATEQALADYTARWSNTRPLIRQEILQLHSAGLSWRIIKESPLGRAFYGPLLGT